VQHWNLVFQCRHNIEDTKRRFQCPKEELAGLTGNDLEKKIGEHLDDPKKRQRFRIFFINEYYPAIIHSRDKMVLLQKSIETLIDRGALRDRNREITRIVSKLAPEWFIQD